MNLKDIIAPSFYGLHNDIKEEKHTHYYLKGGRGSTKSSFVSIEIILGIMKDKNANAIALRRHKDNLRASVYEQLLWAIEMLGVQEEWVGRLTPLELIYKPTGQKILFRGMDDPTKIKSIKFRKGYCKFLLYEEAAEVGGAEKIRNINQSLMRGGNGFICFYSYNPPKSQRNWINIEVTQPRDDKIVHSSTYLSVPEEWLGQQFILEAEELKKSNNKLYEHEYLGEVTGTGGEVFTNITIREITDSEIKSFDHVLRGLDFGFAADPTAYEVMHYDGTRKKLYIFYEFYEYGVTNRALAKEIQKENRKNNMVICDSAEPKSIAELNEYKVKAMGAKKGPDSVEYGIHRLQDLTEIIIDPVRCPNAKREFYGYELDEDGNGGFISRFPDRDNHSIDAVRYAMEASWRPKRRKKEEPIINFSVERPKKATGRGTKRKVI